MKRIARAIIIGLCTVHGPQPEVKSLRLKCVHDNRIAAFGNLKRRCATPRSRRICVLQCPACHKGMQQPRVSQASDLKVAELIDVDCQCAVIAIEA